jgi:hypothetical protein
MPAFISALGEAKPTLVELLTTLLSVVVVTGNIDGELPTYKLYCFHELCGVVDFVLPSNNSVSLGVTTNPDL